MTKNNGHTPFDDETPFAPDADPKQAKNPFANSVFAFCYIRAIISDSHSCMGFLTPASALPEDQFQVFNRQIPVPTGAHELVPVMSPALAALFATYAQVSMWRKIEKNSAAVRDFYRQHLRYFGRWGIKTCHEKLRDSIMNVIKRFPKESMEVIDRRRRSVQPDLEEDDQAPEEEVPP